ncbi:MAG: radical SAM family heme chaperone HemW [Paludibacteraceae bacterium]|nr:radical SAM family heme chaperone HemW [Paludibacteraceae bacterium]
MEEGLVAGLYIHIPFCKKRCLYCDFFSTTQLERREEYVQAVLRELEQRKDEAGEPIRTIYIGGGTPSTLSIELTTAINQLITSYQPAEYTIEVNPGDVTKEYLQGLRSLGLNRLSMGVQSFQDELLQLIGRRHNARQAIEAVKIAQEAGFDNISIDLMYALPTQSMEQWKADIETALSLGIQHVSCYGLMYEEGTALTKMLEEGQIEAIDEDTENAMYDMLCDYLQQAGFVHYEVSNFALPGYEAKHNSAYWDHTPYIGIGAGAHSFIPPVRSWNPSDLDAYISGITAQNLQRESETLTKDDLYNERMMLGLRTNRGVTKSLIRKDISAYIANGLLRETEDGHIVATRQGIHILNRIIEDLMI